MKFYSDEPRRCALLTLMHGGVLSGAKVVLLKTPQSIIFE